MVGETIVIKGVEDKAYRKLKAMAAKERMKIGEAAIRAFKAWTRELRSATIRDADRMKKASQIMDRNRSKPRQLENWSSVRVIREMRRKRTTN